MATFEVLALNILGIISYVVGAYIAIEYILPRVRIIMAEVIRYPKTTEAITYLLAILVYIIAAQGIVNRVFSMGIPALNFINVINPAIDVINGIMPVIKLLIIGVGAILVAERIRLKA